MESSYTCIIFINFLGNHENCLKCVLALLFHISEIVQMVRGGGGSQIMKLMRQMRLNISKLNHYHNNNSWQFISISQHSSIQYLVFARRKQCLSMCDFLKTFLDTNHEHCLKFMQSLLLHIFEIVQMVGFAGVPQK